MLLYSVLSDFYRSTSGILKTPGARSSKLDKITSISQNRQFQHVLASSGSTGYIVAQDLHNKCEVVALVSGGVGQVGIIGGGGGRRGMSSVA